MISVLLWILKILGLVLLVLLGLALLVILLVLLVPVRYQAEGSFEGAVKGKAGVSWLLHLVSCQVSYEKDLSIQVRILGFPLRLGGKSGEEGTEGEPESSEKTETGVGEKPEAEGKQEPKQAGETFEERRTDTDPVEPVLEAQEIKEPPESKKVFSASGLCDKLKQKAAGIRQKLLGLREKVQDIREKMLSLKEKKDLILDFLRDEENRKAFSLVKRKVFALLRHALPKKLKGRVRFGFDDPSTTGTILMYAAPFYGLYARQFELIPDFEETGIEGEARLSGRVRVGYLLLLGIQLLLSRHFRRLLKKIKKLRQELG